MPKILVIDSHKSGSENDIVQNLHWKNAQIISEHLGADFVWSYPFVNKRVKSGYDVIIFNHSSPYSFMDMAWLEENPSAKIFFVTNEYNLGEDMMMWKYCKEHNKKFHVIANHPQAASKVVKYLTESWHIVNLNCLIIKETPSAFPFFRDMDSAVYYGSFRKDRVEYIRKYADQVIISTHQKNLERFADVGMTKFKTMERVDVNNGLGVFGASLYIEDKKTHKNYNFLANRFYEALNANIPMMFDLSCKSTMDKSGYDIENFLLTGSVKDKLDEYSNNADDILSQLADLRIRAVREKKEVLREISRMINT
jgi:hypothetical protein